MVVRRACRVSAGPGAKAGRCSWFRRCRGCICPCHVLPGRRTWPRGQCRWRNRQKPVGGRSARSMSLAFVVGVRELQGGPPSHGREESLRSWPSLGVCGRGRGLPRARGAGLWGGLPPQRDPRPPDPASPARPASRAQAAGGAGRAEGVGQHVAQRLRSGCPSGARLTFRNSRARPVLRCQRDETWRSDGTRGPPAQSAPLLASGGSQPAPTLSLSSCCTPTGLGSSSGAMWSRLAPAG